MDALTFNIVDWIAIELKFHSLRFECTALVDICVVHVLCYWFVPCLYLRLLISPPPWDDMVWLSTTPCRLLKNHTSAHALFQGSHTLMLPNPSSYKAPCSIYILAYLRFHMDMCTNESPCIVHRKTTSACMRAYLIMCDWSEVFPINKTPHTRRPHSIMHQLYIYI